LQNISGLSGKACIDALGATKCDLLAAMGSLIMSTCLIPQSQVPSRSLPKLHTVATLGDVTLGGAALVTSTDASLSAIHSRE